MVFQEANNITNMTVLIQYGNEVTSGWLGIFIVILFAAIPLFIGRDRFPFSRTFAASTFLGMIIAILLNQAGIVTMFVVIIFVALWAGGLVWLIKEERQ